MSTPLNWFDRLTASRVTHALELSARFTEERHRVLAENVANVDTPDYQTKRLDVGAFQGALHDAFASAESARSQQLELRDTEQTRTNARGELEVRPFIEPPQNVLFHDGTNARLERLISDVQENALQHQMALNLLGTRFDGLMTAIRGRLQ